MAKIKEFDFVEVEWLDAHTGFSEPLTIEELEKEQDILSYSAGYLISQNKERIILGFLLFDNINLVKHWQVIPKGMVKKIKKIKKNKDN